MLRQSSKLETHEEASNKPANYIRLRLTGHFVMLCSHWLILTLSSSVVHFFKSRSQPQYGSLAPTHALRGERESSSLYNSVKLSYKYRQRLHRDGTENQTSGVDRKIKRRELTENVRR